jgi:hypothetical protein
VALRPFVLELRELTDPTLLVLKAHLIVEQQLLRWITVHCPNPSPITSRGRLGFSTRLAIAEALGLPGEFDAIWNANRKLNELRNTIAHQIDPKRVDALIEELAALAFDNSNAAAQALKGLDRTARLQRLLPFLLYTIGHSIALISSEKAAHGKTFWEAGPKRSPIVHLEVEKNSITRSDKSSRKRKGVRAHKK